MKSLFKDDYFHFFLTYTYMWEPKALFFSVFLFYYFSFTFRPKFLTRELGLDDSQLGATTTCNYVVGAAGASIWAFIANKTGGHRYYIIVNTIAACLVFFALKLLGDQFGLILVVLIAFQFLLSGTYIL